MCLWRGCRGPAWSLSPESPSLRKSYCCLLGTTLWPKAFMTQPPHSPRRQNSQWHVCLILHIQRLLSLLSLLLTLLPLLPLSPAPHGWPTVLGQDSATIPLIHPPQDPATHKHALLHHNPLLLLPLLSLQYLCPTVAMARH